MVDASTLFIGGFLPGELVLPAVALLGAAAMGPLLGGIAAGWLVSLGLAAWKRMAGIAGAATMGLGVSLYLGRQHHPSMGSSVCNLNETFNCDVVNASVYSELWGIPIAFFGSAFYAGVIAVAAMSLLGRKQHDRAAHAVFAGAVLSVIYSAYLAWASVQLGAWCLFCISLYGVNLILAGASFMEVKASGSPLGEGIQAALWGKDDRSVSVMSVAGVAVFLTAMLWYRGMGPADGSSAVVMSGGKVDYSSMYEVTPAEVRLGGSEPVLGAPTAPYTLVEFADFECPACGRISDEVKKLPEQVPSLKLMFKHYPLSNACNASVESSFHEHACGAAKGAECARQQGRFWELGRLMFKNQQYLAPADLEMMAGQVSMDLATWKSCLDQPATLSTITADVAAANALGISGTPSLYLHGLGPSGTWVKVFGGPADVKTLVEAHKAGKLTVGG